MKDGQDNIPPDLDDSEFLEQAKGVSNACFLRSLQEKRRRHWQSCLNNRDKSIERMSEIYTDPTHFVYELLQNAEDAEAGKIAFCLAGDTLTVTHDGKAFSREDIMSITTTGTTSKTDLNAIGKFGVGFKSVFAVTDAPEIHSGDFCFRIENFIVPRPMSSPAAYSTASQTTIRLPLKNGGDGLREQIKKAISGFGATAIIFLKNIKVLNWECKQSGESDFCEKSEHLEQCGNNISAGVTKFRNKKSENCGEYFFLRRHEELGGKLLYLAAACRMQNGGIVKMKIAPRLSVYFPVEHVNPGLSFMLHVPYRTTPARETCDFGDADNKMLTEMAAGFIADALPILRDKGKLTPNCINDVLPWTSPWGSVSYHEIYRAIAGKVKEEFMSDKLLPTLCGKYAAAQDVIATDKYMPQIVIGADCVSGVMPSARASQYCNRNMWLDQGIEFTVTRSLNIPDYHIGDFLSNAKDEFLVRLSHEQMAGFYRALSRWHRDTGERRRGRGGGLEQRKTAERRAESIRSDMQNNPIVRLDKPHGGKQHARAFVGGNPFVYLPKENSPRRFPTVAPYFLREGDGEVSVFLKQTLGIQEPDDIAEIREIVRRYVGDIAPDGHVADMRRILDVAAIKKEAVKDAIGGKPVVKTVRGNGAGGFAAFERAFFRTGDLSRVFAGDDNAHFVDESFYDNEFGGVKFAESGDWRNLFASLGVEKTLQINTSKMEGLKHAFASIEESDGDGGFDRSTALWRFLVRSVRGHNEYERGILRKEMLKFSWLYDQHENRIPAGDIGKYALEEIHSQYGEAADDDVVALLAKTVGLRFDDVKELTKQVAQRDEKIEKMHRENKKLREELDNIRRGNNGRGAGDDENDKTPPPKIKIKRHDWGVDIGNGGNGGGGGGGTAPESAKKGRLGERALTQWLQEQYPDATVIDANAGGQRQTGYDISVTQNGVTEYYECKAFDNATPPRRVPMTRRQMEKAEEEGERYFLCVIYNLGDDTVKMLKPIRNPASKLERRADRWGVDVSSGAEE